MNSYNFFKHPKSLAAFMLLAVSLGSGCAAGPQRPTPAAPVTPAQAYREPEQRYNNPGSLYSESSSAGLFEDNRARRVGDLVVVQVVENTKAKNKAETDADRESSINLGVEAAFGRKTVSPLYAFAPLGLASGKVGADPMLAAKSSSAFSGSGETKRENYVTTSVGARVHQILPGGVLQIEGAREIRVNGETEYLVVRGLVRPSDVRSDNTVLSTQMADSTVAYYGSGIISDKQKPGWLTRVLDNIWPF